MAGACIFVRRIARYRFKQMGKHWIGPAPNPLPLWISAIMTSDTISFVPDYCSPPGDTLREAIAQRSMTQSDLADRLGMSRKHVGGILDGKAPISPETALKLERVLGMPARFWNAREQQYRDFRARQDEARQLESQLQWRRQFKHFNKMVAMGWLPESSNPLGQVRALLDFFGVATPEAWEQKWASMPVQYRKSNTFQTDPAALAAWLRRGEQLAQRIDCPAFDEGKFRAALHAVRPLTRKPLREAWPEATKICAACGVAVVLVPELPKTASGAARWLSPTKGLIQLSLKYKADDHFWFSFFHEAAHILLHKKRDIYLDGSHTDGDPMEQEANALAEKILIPQEAMSRFMSQGPPTLPEVEAFAERHAIAPGIVVGQLQHRRIYARERGNRLKRRLDWSDFQ